MEEIISQRPIVIIANSSFYILHYRELLLKNLRKNNHIITIAPIDSSTKKLSEISIHLPLRINRKNDLNTFSFIISFLRLLFLIRAIKPKLVHGHTLKTNLLVAIVTSIYSIPSVLSFTGLGKLSTSKKYNFILRISIKTIYFFSKREFRGFLKVKQNVNRTKFIFQNNNDKLCFESINNNKNSLQSKVIYGSGIPNKYLSFSKNKTYKFKFKNIKSLPRMQFIFCGRLLLSKGIKTFLLLAGKFPDHDFIVFGERDPSSNESISEECLNRFRNKSNIKLMGYKKNPLLELDFKYPILIVPSNYGEGMPRAILEAFSLGIPTICSKSATCNLFTNENLYISEGDNVEDYKLCIAKLFEDIRRDNLSKRLELSQKISKNFTEKKIVKQTLSLYKELLDFQMIPNIMRDNIRKSFNLFP